MKKEVGEEFLKAGIPIHKIDMLRPLLKKNGYRLTGSSNLGQYISLIFKQETESKNYLCQAVQMGQETFQ